MATLPQPVAPSGAVTAETVTPPAVAVPTPAPAPTLPPTPENPMVKIVTAETTETPKYIRVPDIQRLFGLKKSHVYKLIECGALETVSLRREGTRRGVRLVGYESLIRYVEKLRKTDFKGGAK